MLRHGCAGGLGPNGERPGHARHSGIFGSSNRCISPCPCRRRRRSRCCSSNDIWRDGNRYAHNHPQDHRPHYHTCSEEVSVIDAAATSPRFFAESNSVAASGTGATRTCKLSIPYAWALATQTSDNMSTSYSVSGITSTGLPQRTSSLSPLDTRKVPANGTTTALTAAVTL
jgi:hypothetical protein